MAISWLTRGISGTSGQGVEELASEVNRWNVGLLLKNADTGTRHSARKIREVKRLIVSTSEAWSEYLLLICICSMRIQACSFCDATLTKKRNEAFLVMMTCVGRALHIVVFKRKCVSPRSNFESNCWVNVLLLVSVPYCTEIYVL